MIEVRREQSSDQEQVRRVNEAAFERRVEADLVERLQRGDSHLISLVALEDDRVVGHILFSAVQLHGSGKRSGMGLGPMSVEPAHQSRGVGGALIRAGLTACREEGVEFVVVLGHSTYYPRFGFEPAASRGVESKYEVPEDVFMVMELVSGSLESGGFVEYDPAFEEAEEEA